MMEDNFVVKDSGKREKYNSGFQRDTQDGKSRPDLICPLFRHRLGLHLAKGAVKYTEFNWALGQPFSRALASLHRHLCQYECGERSEDHMSAIAFAAMCLISYEERIKLGILPADLNDVNKQNRICEQEKPDSVLEDFAAGLEDTQPMPVPTQVDLGM
jgi:hypothetical protein